MSIVKTVTIIDVIDDHLDKWTFDNNYNKSKNNIISMINLDSNTSRTNVILRGADGKFISYKNKNVEKSFRVAIENLIPFPKGV